eukprot:5601434-Amphidinium_carterae.1
MMKGVDVDADSDTLSTLKNYGTMRRKSRQLMQQVSSFLKHVVFLPVKRRSVPQGTKIMTCGWVRKWKQVPGAGRKIKCRLCARGFMDAQLPFLSTYGSTASRLSQKMVLSIAATHNFEVFSLDVPKAFLPGFCYSELEQIYKVHQPTRKRMVPHCTAGACQEGWSTWEPVRELLQLLKAMYGPADAPQQWQ